MAEIEIGANDARIQITATAGQTVLAYDFPIFDEDHIVVQQTLASDGTTSTLTITTHYTVTGVGEEAGGTVVLVTGAAEDDVLTLYRDVPAARTSDFQTAGDFLTATLNREFDLMVMMIQEIVRDQARAVIMASEDSASFDPTLPNVVASKLLQTKDDGTGWQLVSAADIDLATVSAFAATLLDDTTAAAARTTLGLGSAAEADTGAGSGNVPVLDGNGLAAALALAKTLPRVEVTDDVTIGAAHRGRMVVLTTADGSADKDANLPEAASNAGFIVGVLNEDADDAFIIDPNASETVDGAATISLAQNEWRILWCDGTGWVSIAASVPPQAEAEAGTATLPRMWTAQRIAQAIAALASGGAVFDESVSPTGVSTYTFSSIPAGVNRIVVSIADLSGATNTQLTTRLGDSGGVESTGYDSTYVVGGVEANTTTEFKHYSANGNNSSELSGVIVYERVSGNAWVVSAQIAHSNATEWIGTAGSKTLSEELDRVQVIFGSNFDAGSIRCRAFE